MALNQLQYMGLSMSVINYDDIRQRLLTNAKDEDISPFTAVDKYDIHIIEVLHLNMLYCHTLDSNFLLACIGVSLFSIFVIVLTFYFSSPLNLLHFINLFY